MAEQKQRVRRKESRADEILACADKLFLENGFEETTFSDIAKEGKMARSTIYLYFKDKNEILKAILHRSFVSHMPIIQHESLYESKTVGELFNNAVIGIEKFFDEPRFIHRYQMLFNLAIKHPYIAKMMNEESILPTKNLWNQHCARLNVSQKMTDYFFSSLYSIFLMACLSGNIFGEENPLLEFKDFSKIYREGILQLEVLQKNKCNKKGE